MNRNKQVIKISLYGILVNIILVIFKSIFGLIANSISIVLDAVNNLSDALSSIITIVGTKLSEKRPNKKHPFGYGRIEYFSSIIIAILVLIAGVSAFRESFDKIINPTKANYTIITIIIIVSSVLTKFFFGKYVKKEGEHLNSSSLVASGMDAISDSILSLSTLVAALISILFNISVEGYLGVIIAIFIIKSSIEILKETVDNMIGIRAQKSVTNKIKNTIKNYKEVNGVYDLTIHNYGPNKIIASAHVQLDDEMNVREVHRLTRRIELEIYNKYGIMLTLGIYASNDKGEFKDIREYLIKILKKYKNIIQMHGFYVDDEYKLISFDLIFNFDEEKPEVISEKIKNELKKKYPNYTYSVIIDADISD